MGSLVSIPRSKYIMSVLLESSVLMKRDSAEDTTETGS